MIRKYLYGDQFDAGWKAFERGLPKSANPHRLPPWEEDQNPLWTDWAAGWRLASEASQATDPEEFYQLHGIYDDAETA